MKGERVIHMLEEDGLTVTVDPDHDRGYSVTNDKGIFVGRFDTDDTDHFRLGWVPTAKGRRDCLSFIEFLLELPAVF